jgi:phospholipid/cholesterol/gamma-HCH transport system substrate-binding protein
MTRAIREHLRDFLAIIALVAAAIFSVVVILAGQKASVPEWVPLLGSDRFELKAEFSTGQSITPGQGQAVQIAGIRVGDITDVQLEEGNAIVTMEIENQYAELVHTDASLLLRPKTGLNDMVIQMALGDGPETVEEGDTIPLSNTQPNVNPDEFLATLDGDTRAFLKLLLAGGAEGLGGHGLQLSATLRRFEPTVRDLARINGALEKRRASIARGIHNFRLVTDELADKDETVSAFVRSSNEVLQSFANQEANLRAAFRLLPGALRETRGALSSANEFGIVAAPALRKLLPFARALGPALRQSRPFFRQTTGPIRDQIRPFTRQIQTPTLHLRRLAKQLGNTTPPLRGAFQSLNHFLNALAYNPPGANEGYLFWLPWLNHTTNTMFNGQDAQGPLRRGNVMISCTTSRLAESLLTARPFLNTLLQVNQLPLPAAIPGCT